MELIEPTFINKEAGERNIPLTFISYIWTDKIPSGDMALL